jgi:hypothetical protein
VERVHNKVVIEAPRDNELPEDEEELNKAEEELEKLGEDDEDREDEEDGAADVGGDSNHAAEDEELALPPRDGSVVFKVGGSCGFKL